MTTIKDLKNSLEDLSKPFSGMLEKDPYHVIEDEVNEGHGQDNMIGL